MNPKIDKVNRSIEKTKETIAEQQSRLKELERLKTELENADIVMLVRGIDITPAELEAFTRAFIEQRQGCAVPDGFSPPAGNTPYPLKKDDDADEKEGSDDEE